MKAIDRIICAVMLLAPVAAHAAGNTASFYVVHGIPGRDVAATLDPALPVDVLIDGKYCLLQGLSFGHIAGPYDVPAGTYTVAISLANPVAPCSNSAVVTASATLDGGKAGAVVAALNSSAAPAIEVYPIDESAVTAGRQRIVTVHAADAPEVDVKVTVPGKPNRGGKFLLPPGTQKTFQFPAESAFIVEAGVGGAVLGPISVAPGHAGIALIVAVGSGSSGSATLISRIVPDAF